MGQIIMKWQGSHEIIDFYLKKKKERNESYSMRAFARQLDLSPSFISLYLRGKKTFPQKKIDQLLRLTKVTQEDRNAFYQLYIQEIYQGSDLGRFVKKVMSNATSVLGSLFKYQEVKEVNINLLDQWYYIPILDYISCEDFQNDPRWLAKKLNLTHHQACEAIELLKKSDLIVEDDNGQLLKTKKKVRIAFDYSHQNIREYHKSMMERASWHLMNKTDQDAFDQRLITGITIAANRSRVREVRDLLEKSIHQAADHLSQDQCQDIYQINLQFFPHNNP